MRLARARDEPHDAAETIAQVLGSRRKAWAGERMGVAVAIRADRQAEPGFVLGVDVAVRIEADIEGAVDAQQPPQIPVGGATEVRTLLDRLHRSYERLGLRQRIR